MRAPFWLSMSIRVLFSEERILGDAAFTRKPIDHQHDERGISRHV